MDKIPKPLIVLLIFSLISGFALLQKGLPPTHDGEYHVIRFYEFDKVLKDGNLYPRWAPDLNNGYGVPLFNYVYPLPNYFSSLVHLFGVSFIDAFKLGLFTAVLLGGVFFYLWAKIFFDKIGGFVGAVYYLFSPYLFVDVYIRGSVGEVWALAFLPAFLWSITEFIYNNKSKFLPISAMFLALIIFSHNILALMFFPFSIFYSLFLISLSKKKKSLIINLLWLFIVGLGLSAVFWLPALLETKYTVGLQIFDYKNNFPDFYQLLFPSWGSGFFGSGLANEMSVQIGIANILGVLISLFVFFKLFKKKNYRAKLILFFILSFFLVVFLMQKISIPLWENIPLMNYFQFPWRFLSLVILICSFLTASIFAITKSRVAAITLILIVVSLGFNYAHPAHYLYRNDNYYITRSNFIDGTNSIGNVFNTIWIKEKLKKNKDIISNAKNTKIEILERKTTRYKFNVAMDNGSDLTINTAYFPGWEVKVDGKFIKTAPSSNGLIKFKVSQGKHLVEVNFTNTMTRKLAVIITIISFALIVKLLAKNWYIRYK